MSQQELNLLELKPQRNLQWEAREGDLVTLLIPKFKNKYLVKWFAPMLAKPNFKVKLDKFGSYVWSKCDGTMNVEQIGVAMAHQFGEPLESVYERIGKFLAKLARDKIVLLDC